MNCWRCACMFEASLWNKAPSASGGLTAGENLIRHFKDSSHWSLTENKTDQTSLSRNEREREHCRRLLYGMCNSQRVSSSVADDPQRANSVYVCATCASVCVLQISKRLCGYINWLCTDVSLLWCGPLPLMADSYPLRIAKHPQLWTLSLWFGAVDMWNKCNMSQGRQAAFFLSRTVSSLSPSWVVSSIIVHLPLPNLIALFYSPPYIHLTRPLFFLPLSSMFSLVFIIDNLPAWPLKDTSAKCHISHYRNATKKGPYETDGFRTVKTPFLQVIQASEEKKKLSKYSWCWEKELWELMFITLFFFFFFAYPLFSLKKGKIEALT